MHYGQSNSARSSITMIGLGSIVPAVQATLLVGDVLVEAVVLYVGYGAFERIVGSSIFDAIEMI